MTDACDEEAAVRIFWPGKEPMAMCLHHASLAEAVAAALGMYLHAEVLGQPATCQHAANER